MPLPEYSDDSHQEENVEYDDNNDRDGEGCRYLSILMTPTRKRMLTMMTMMTGWRGMPLPEYSDDSHQEEDVDYDDNGDGDGKGCRYLSILMTPTGKRMLTMMTMMTGMARDASI
jgi:hypothetical protein